MAETAGRMQALIHPDTLRLLGGRAVVVESRAAVAGSVRGLTLRYHAVEQLSAFLNASTPQLMRLIEINERTAQRRKEQGVFTADESDRLARVARVTHRAVEALGNEEQAREWLRRPNRALGGAAPLDLLGTDAGSESVTEELGRIEFGDLF